ncbi:MAG TPA: hypothetical protein VFR02_06905 [bacterium]|nr:hypothetical protein [bacterium]
MKNILWFLAVVMIFVPFAVLGLVWPHLPANLSGPGEVFIRQEAADPAGYRADLLAQSPALKAAGFTAYSFHRDLRDPKVTITTLKCSDLAQGLAYLRSAKFEDALDKADPRIPQVWDGLDSKPRLYDKPLPKAPAGLVIARNEVRDYPFWLKCFFAEDGGKHNHPGRHYQNSAYSIHHLPGKPAVAIVVHEASDVSKAPAFMRSGPLNGEMESTGVIGLEVWYAVNLSSGTF